ncbi:hypothetical protein WKI71_21035 [Streptomyces sp. MS1.AVA.1]|uniref:ABC transporter permease n=1 Tax=Streptomyces machairae TaxID=3134109 RepID=A0ABU8UM62_9ACTN
MPGWIELVATSLTYAILPVAGWAGGSLIGRELESGTARLAWTQSVTPTRWLAAKLAVPAVLLTIGTGGLVLLNNWARGDGDPDLVGDWYNADAFIGTGPTTVGYTLAGLALGALAGLLLRRALASAGVGFLAALVLCGVLERFREDLWPAVTRSQAGEFELPDRPGSWAGTRPGPASRRGRTIGHQRHFPPPVPLLADPVRRNRHPARRGRRRDARRLLAAAPPHAVDPAARPSRGKGRAVRTAARRCRRPRAAPRYPTRHVSVTIGSDGLATLSQ